MSLDERLAEHGRLASMLVDEWQSDGVSLSLLTLLDYCAIVGVRLARLESVDFRDDGVSLPSLAYFERISARA